MWCIVAWEAFESVARHLLVTMRNTKVQVPLLPGKKNGNKGSCRGFLDKSEEGGGGVIDLFVGNDACFCPAVGVCFSSALIKESVAQQEESDAYILRSTRVD